MRILIVSCGTRNKLIRFIKSEPKTEWVAAADCSPYAPALYEADAYHIVPRMTDPVYLSAILSICRRDKIDALLPLQEDELFLMAQNRTMFEKTGVTLIVSPPESVELCRDKYRFYEYLLSKDIPALKTWADFNEFDVDYRNKKASFPVFVKPVRGCGSIGISKVECMELLEVLSKYSKEELLIQQLCAGDEFGADIYVDLLDGNVKEIFVKQKIRMRAGETEKSVSYKNEDLFELIKKTVKGLSLRGPVDMDIFRMDGKFYISEINPRFGGGYPHAYGCGVNFPKLIANNISGNVNEENIGNYDEGICMMKYQDEIIREL